MSLKLIDGSVFLHIPKTGGMWVARVLKEQGLVAEEYRRHSDYDLTLFAERVGPLRKLPRAIVGEYLRTRFSPVAPQEDARTFRFCFVRNPFSWIESWWTFRKKYKFIDFGALNSTARWDYVAPLNAIRGAEFNAFVRSFIADRPGFISHMYWDFANPGISFVGKQENLCDDLLSVLDTLGLKHSKDKIRRSEPVNKSSKRVIDWDPGLRDAFAYLEAAAFKRFGYATGQDSGNTWSPPAV